MENEFPFYNAVLSSLPTDLCSGLENLSAAGVIDNVLRLVVGAECPAEWLESQKKIKKSIDDLLHSKRKRPREDDGEGLDSKRQRTDDPAQYKFHSISTTSPIRKKVDIVIHKHSIQFVNPSSGACESTIQIANLKRAFILPTRAKQKPHWTVVILSNDMPDRSKNGLVEQVIFGMEAVASSPMTSTDLTTPDSQPKTLKKGEETISYIQTLLSLLPIPILQPSPSVSTFKSSCAPQNTNPGATSGVEAYLGAKSGTLWFFDEGILWGENKPCEFWALDDLLPKGNTSGGEAVRIVSATGRICSVFLTRKGEGEGGDDTEQDLGEETQFAMIDAREQEPILRWVKERRHRFGKPPGSVASPVKQDKGKGKQKEKEKDVIAGPITIHHLPMHDASDDSDDDFQASSPSSRSGASDLSSERGDSDVDADASGEEDPEADGDADASGDEEMEDEEELDPKHHPLLRPGAMPRMSRATMDMVVGMVEEDVGMAGVDELDDD